MAHACHPRHSGVLRQEDCKFKVNLGNLNLDLKSSKDENGDPIYVIKKQRRLLSVMPSGTQEVERG